MTDDRTPKPGTSGGETPGGKKRGTPDDAYDRLRAADPARGLEPDAARLDAAVAARTSRPADAPAVPVAVGAPAESDETAELTEYAEVRTLRRPNRWLQVAAVAV